MFVFWKVCRMIQSIFNNSAYEWTMYCYLDKREASSFRCGGACALIDRRGESLMYGHSRRRRPALRAAREVMLRLNSNRTSRDENPPAYLDAFKSSGLSLRIDSNFIARFAR